MSRAAPPLLGPAPAAPPVDPALNEPPRPGAPPGPGGGPAAPPGCLPLLDAPPGPAPGAVLGTVLLLLVDAATSSLALFLPATFALRDLVVRRVSYKRRR